MFFAATFVLASALVASAADINVAVGANNQLVFDPPSVTANNGDTIHFEFTSKNHSVTQSTFASPCVRSPSGIDSGFLAVTTDATSHPSWSFTVNDASTPLWFFCAQTNPVVHCQMGMVFAVNPTADKSFDAFQNAAKNGAASPSGGASGAAPSGASSPATGGASGVIPAPTSLPTAAGGAPGVSGGVSPPSGSGFSTVNTNTGAAASTGSAAPAASSGTTPNGAIVNRGLSSAGAVSIASLIAAVAGFML